MDQLSMYLSSFEDELDRWGAKYKELVEPSVQLIRQAASKALGGGDSFVQVIRQALLKLAGRGYSLVDFKREREEIWAHQRARYDPQPEIEGIFDRMCSEYLSATPQEREQCRSLIRERETILAYLLGYVHSAAKRVSTTKEIEDLRRGLAAASIEDCTCDYRDFLMALASLWVAAERVGIDPQPHFREMASLSSEKQPQGGSTPVAEMMNNFQDYAVVRERRAAQGEWPLSAFGRSG
jgi:hypothetical protein